MSEDKPCVSIGLPVYNGERYLEKTLSSILAQTFSDFELIISDNGSTDKTEEICKIYATKDSRIHYHRNETNLGAAKNYNLTFQLSSGKYFKWVAHDDLYAPEYLERCVEILNREPEVVLCYSKTNIIDESGDFIEHYFDGHNFRSPKPAERFRDFLHTHGLCNPVFGLIRASALKKTPLIGNYSSSDRVLLGELVLIGQFYEVSEYLFFRRIHPQRSLQANTADSIEIASWFDPAKRVKILLPKWRRLFEYFNAVRRVPLNWTQRIRCYMQLGYFILVPEKWGGLLNDLFKTTNLLLKSR